MQNPIIFANFLGRRKLQDAFKSRKLGHTKAESRGMGIKETHLRIKRYRGDGKNKSIEGLMLSAMDDHRKLRKN